MNMTQKEFEAKVLQYDGLCKKLANKYCNKKVEFDDLYQEGVIGLIKAIESYDVAAGTKEITHYYNYVNGHLLNYLRDKVNIVANNRRVIEAVNKAYRMRLEDATVQELVREMDITVEMATAIREHIDIKANYVFLDKQASNSEKEDMYNVLPTEDSFSCCDIRMLIDSMEDEDKFIINKVIEGYPTRDIARDLKRSAGYVTRAIRRIKENLNKKLDLGYIL